MSQIEAGKRCQPSAGQSADGGCATAAAVLDPDVVLRVDHAAGLPGAVREVHGAAAVARRARVGGTRETQTALVNGAVGIVVAPRGRLVRVLAFTITGERIVEIDVVTDPERLARLDLGVLGD